MTTLSHEGEGGSGAEGVKGERQEQSEAKTPSDPFLRGTLSLAPPRLPVRNALADREAWSERQRINRAYSRTYTHRPTFLHVGSHGWQRCGADEEHRYVAWNATIGYDCECGIIS